MKVGFIITGLRMGGAEMQLSQIAKKVIEEGGDAFIIALINDQHVNIGSGEIKIYKLGLGKSPVSLLRGLIGARKIVKSEKPGVINSHLFHANLFARFLKLISFSRVRLISTYHSKAIGGRKRKFLLKITDFLSSVTVSVSKEAYLELVESKVVPKNKSRYIYNGIDTNVFSFDLAARNKKREELGVGCDETVLISVGRLTEAKDYNNLISAVKKICDKNRFGKIRVWIVGEGPLRKEIEDKIEEEGLSSTVSMLGINYDMPGLLSAADLFVLSSAWEGFSLATAEAMSCERMIVATDAGGVREVLGDCGGIIVPVKDSSLLAKGIEEALVVPAEKRGVVGALLRRRIVENFSIEVFCEKWINLYRENSN